jgi:acyl carrier protein phosphodiesterase
MNWLAHLYLSEPNPAYRLGNILPDIVSYAALESLPADFQRGIVQHRRIDVFTDTHPVFRRSIRRIKPPFRRYGGILCDMFYDHFLARDWSTHSPEPLPEFIGTVYASFEDFRATLPPEACEPLTRMKQEDWLGSYGELSGLTIALERISKRFRRPVELARAIPVLERHYEELQGDFREFFPELKRHAAAAH